MKRGDIVSIAAGSGYGGKPRPAVIVQSDLYVSTASVVVCLFTSDPKEITITRHLIDPDDVNNLERRSWLMIDKILAVRRDKVGRHIGRLSPGKMGELDRSLLVFLGLAGE